MTILETLTEEQTEQLQQAQDIITVKVLDSLNYGDEIKLNSTFKLYHYSEEDIVVIGFIDDEVENWEVIQLQWDTETELIIFEAL